MPATGSAIWEKEIERIRSQENSSFLMPIEDIFSMSGRGTVVTGRIERGEIKVGDLLEIVGPGGVRKSHVAGLEMFRKLIDTAKAGDNVGILLRGIDKEMLRIGDVLAKPGSIGVHKKFEAEIYLLAKSEGGRASPIFKNYRPNFYFRMPAVAGGISFPQGIDRLDPGESLTIRVDLDSAIAIEAGSRFNIQEHGKIMGSGVVTKILE